MRALYAYFMNEVEPVAKPNRASDIPWPFNMRWPLKIWNALFTEQQRFVARPEQSEQWNRGAYLVQGLGHCGTCHTPRGLNMAEQGLDERSPQFLAGAILGGWYAPDLRGLAALDDDELFDLLSRGQSRNHAFAGPMADIRSMMFYLGDLAPVARQLQVAGPRPAEQALADGQLLYGRYCSTCHGSEGEGEPGVAPRLTGRNDGQHGRALNLVNAILQGAERANLDGELSFQMPGYAELLDDRQILDLSNYILTRTAWDNQAQPLTLGQVSQLRRQAAGPLLSDYTGLLLALMLLLVAFGLLLIRRRWLKRQR